MDKFVHDAWLYSSILLPLILYHGWLLLQWTSQPTLPRVLNVHTYAPICPYVIGVPTLYFQSFMPEIQVTNKPKEANVTEEVENKATNDEAEKKDDKVLIKKWGKEAIDVGYTVLPKALLQGQARLKINATDLAVLIHLIEHWWRPDEMPWPKKARIAERLAVTPKTVQRSIARLEEEGLLKRVNRFNNGRRVSNEYDLSPLVERIKAISLDMAKAKEEAAQAKRKAVRPGARKRAQAAA